ncbi:glucose-1-phosphate adenylyltransferase [Eubacteriales bacterium OttesenSCG-928-G02]|nr:glucose-1-phosphate adenylyltransferase [Eubacteriales bacterium OttesenSCG-928-G02]
MIKKKECIAMLLAGGQGSRLRLLTEKTAKPAVTFGGKYKIIDFPLSNCVHSRIDTVGVLTQYQPLVLNEYIGDGRPWDLDRAWGGIMVLPPYQASKRADWYKGTANAIYQNITFIKRYLPDYVLILSGDHIYKMDYDKMLEKHKDNKADCTIAVIDVPAEETSRFGIMSTDINNKIFKFEEKPKKTDSTKASMGIYIFNTDKLIKYLTEDDENPKSENDFGKNIIPEMLKNQEKLFAYPFDGYWKDVGTIDSLWQANMDLLGEKPEFSIHDYSWRIFSRNYAEPPHFIGNNAKISNSLITEGCEINGTVINSVLSSGVRVEKNAIVKDSVIHSGVVIGADSVVNYSIIDSGTSTGINTSIGKEKETAAGITLVGGDLTIKNRSQIPDNVNVDEIFLEKLYEKEGE